MSARLEAAGPGNSLPLTDLVECLRAEGLTPITWANSAGDRYDWHRHDYHKVLFCVSGSIVFHTREGDLELHPGDRVRPSGSSA